MPRIPSFIAGVQSISGPGPEHARPDGGRTEGQDCFGALTAYLDSLQGVQSPKLPWATLLPSSPAGLLSSVLLQLQQRASASLDPFAMHPKNFNRGQSTASYVRIDTTMNVRACPKFCKCQCHVHTYFQTPRILRDIVGQLFFSYTGQLRASACNYPPCRQSNVKRRFT